jgi:hypothetical protein
MFEYEALQLSVLDTRYMVGGANVVEHLQCFAQC